MILSWDIGIYNLSYCLLEKKSTKSELDKQDISNNNTESNTESNTNNNTESNIENNTESNIESNTESNTNNNTESNIENNTESNTNNNTESNNEYNKIYKYPGYKIKDWGIVNIADKMNIRKNKKGVFDNIPDILDKYTDFLKADYVLIENQPCMKNPTMKSIQIIIYSYF